VDFEAKLARVVFDPSLAKANDMLAALEQAGYGGTIVRESGP
jgi:hypothetical protein